MSILERTHSGTKAFCIIKWKVLLTAEICTRQGEHKKVTQNETTWCSWTFKARSIAILSTVDKFLNPKTLNPIWSKKSATTTTLEAQTLQCYTKFMADGRGRNPAEQWHSPLSAFVIYVIPQRKKDLQCLEHTKLYHMNKNIQKVYPSYTYILIFCNWTNTIQLTFKVSLIGRYSIAIPQIYDTLHSTKTLHTPYCQLTM